MKKRLMAALLPAALAAGTLSAAGVAVDSKDASAYLEAMDNMPHASSYLVDFDGDGADELLLWDYRNSDNTQYEVWDSGKKLASGSLEFQLGTETAYYEIAHSKIEPDKLFAIYVLPA